MSEWEDTGLQICTDHAPATVMYKEEYCPLCAERKRSEKLAQAIKDIRYWVDMARITDMHMIDCNIITPDLWLAEIKDVIWEAQ